MVPEYTEALLRYKWKSLSLIVLAVGLGIVVFLSKQQQDIRNHAQAGAIACTAASGQPKRPDDTTQLQALTKELSLPSSQEPAMLQQLQGKLQQRKNLLLTLIDHDPQQALQFILPASARQGFSQLTKNCVEQTVTLTGTLETEHVDYPDGEGATVTYLQTDPLHRLQLHFQNQEQIPQSGASLTVSGMQLDDQVLVTKTVTTQAVTGTAVSPVAIGQKNMLVMLVYFQNTTQPSLTKATIQNFMFTNVNNYYKENSFNKFSFVGSVTDWFQIPIAGTQQALCGNGNEEKAVQAAINVIDPTVDFTQYDRLTIIGPFPCTWAGIGGLSPFTFQTQDGTINVPVLWVDSDYATHLGIVAHEIGHTLGLNHAGFYDCGNVTISDTCSIPPPPNDVGDKFGMMGSGQLGHFSAAHKDYVGWFSPSQELTVTQSGTYTVYPYAAQDDKLKVLKIKHNDKGQYLYVQYRQPIGYDSGWTNTDIYSGALFHMNDGARSGVLDMSPPTEPYYVALLPNQSFTDPDTGTVITVTGRTDAALTVQVTLKPQPTPTPVPTAMPTPTPTSKPGPTPTSQPPSAVTKLTLTLLLQGIGRGGDSVAPHEQGNNQPRTPQRTVAVKLYKDATTLVTLQTTTVTFDPAQGDFTGTLSLPSNVLSGSYTLYFKTPTYITGKTTSQIIQSQTTNLPAVTLVAGDSNDDDTLNILDYNLIIGCYTDLQPAKACTLAKSQATDINDDGQVNQYDYNLFLRNLSVH